MVAVLLLVVFSFVIFRDLRDSLRRAVEVADGLAEGRMPERIEVASDDEIGRLLMAMSRMLDYLRETRAIKVGVVDLVMFRPFPAGGPPPQRNPSSERYGQ